jgi:hypothetical protein
METVVVNCKRCDGHGCPRCEWCGKIARTVSHEQADAIYESRRLRREGERVPSIVEEE